MGLMDEFDHPELICTMRRTNVGLVCDGELFAELNADLGRDQAAKLPRWSTGF